MSEEIPQEVAEAIAEAPPVPEELGGVKTLALRIPLRRPEGDPDEKEQYVYPPGLIFGGQHKRVDGGTIRFFLGTAMVPEDHPDLPALFRKYPAIEVANTDGDTRKVYIDPDTGKEYASLEGYRAAQKAKAKAEKQAADRAAREAAKAAARG